MNPIESETLDTFHNYVKIYGGSVYFTETDYTGKPDDTINDGIYFKRIDL